ncbi:proton channel OTOP2-like [Lampris incognitus]|uniref:proton channel OTOP2-like n=1 Tax=Lampris incognitus TaxID=2546036 RepID=UPI0024B60242|nr:proton channel OTOP2-like [Lampris incognitus]
MEVHPSNIETAAQMESVQHLQGSEAVRERAYNGGGWLLSGIMCVNILLLGCALVSGSAFNSVAITTVHRQIFLIILLLLTILWMVFYSIITYRKNQALPLKDSHAGPVWLRAGLVLFGVLSLIMDIFKIANYVGYIHCDSPVKVAFPVVQAVFLFVQTYFLWIHAQDCVQLHKNFTRYGLAVTLSTNLVLWMAAVTEESVHQTEIPENANVTRSIDLQPPILVSAGYGDDKCKCSHSSCSLFKEAYFYLYPFNIEYSLFASAMAYVMWHNVGRVVEDHSHRNTKFCLKHMYVGPVAGILLVLAGLATFIVYEVEVVEENQEKINNALMMHFIMNIVIVSLMSVSTVVGCAIYRLDKRERVSEKNPTRSLDVGLLVGASIGQFIISYFTIVAVVATGAKGHLNALNLAWAILTVVQLGLQNFFIIEGLHREPLRAVQEAELHVSGHALQSHTEMSVILKNNKPRNNFTSTQDRLSCKRRALKEVCLFLLLANAILWIMPAFGARPQFDHSVEIKFYKFTMWAAIVNIGLPFGIFYRMHSVASLLELYVMS